MNQPFNHAPDTLPKPILPSWVFDRQIPDCLEDAAFSSGSALSLLHVLLNGPATNVPVELLRNRLALKAAINCLKIEGRMATEADIRDAFYLTAPGDAMGPAGGMFAFWRTGSGVTLSRVAGSRLGLRQTQWQSRLVEVLPEEVRDGVLIELDRAPPCGGGPMAAAITILEGVLKNFPRHEVTALLCADAVLARGLGWARPLPLFGLHLSRKTVRAATEGDDVRIDIHVAASRAAQEAIRLAYDLARRAARLREIEPKLRTKGSAEAVNLFLSEDAVYAPTMLSPMVRGSNVPMTDRSARRFCDRLIRLGVVRELTGRKTFRLYGVA